MDFFNDVLCYCINLDRRTDRWEQAQQQFGKIGIAEKVARVSALTDVTLKSTVISSAEQSLIETNLGIIRQAGARGPICIFEDDVYFLDDYGIHEIMASVSRQLPNDFGLLYLGAHLFDPVIVHPLAAPNLVSLLPEKNPTEEKDHVFVGGAHAVIYSVRALELVRSLPTHLFFEQQWDVFLSKYLIPALPCFMAYPAFAFQREDVSDIEGGQTQRDWIIAHNKTRINEGIYSKSLLKRFWAYAVRMVAGR